MKISLRYRNIYTELQDLLENYAMLIRDDAVWTKENCGADGKKPHMSEFFFTKMHLFFLK